MCAELIPGYRFTAGHVPLEASHHRRQVSSEHGAKPEDVWEPANRDRHVLKHMRIDRYPQSALLVMAWQDSPRYE